MVCSFKIDNWFYICISCVEMTTTNKQWSVVYDEHYQFCYQRITDGTFYDIDSGLVVTDKFKLGCKLTHLDMSVDNNQPMYLIEITNELVVVCFDRMGNIVKQLMSSKDKKDGNENKDNGNEDDEDEDYVSWWKVLDATDSMEVINGKLKMVGRQNKIVEHILDDMEEEDVPWSNGVGYKTFNDYACHVYFVQGSVVPYFGHRGKITNLETKHTVTQLPDGNMYHILLDSNITTPVNLIVHSHCAIVVVADTSKLTHIVWFDSYEPSASFLNIMLQGDPKDLKAYTIDLLQPLIVSATSS